VIAVAREMLDVSILHKYAVLVSNASEGAVTD
jgi:hypothetical protein